MEEPLTRTALPPAATALLFPAGGYLWPGMGADLEGSARQSVVDRVDEALATQGVRRGSLRRVMAGDRQARRDRDADGWRWTGDFPLSMAAQFTLGTALAQEFIDRHGPPGALAGESMGELAAGAAAEAISLEEAAMLTYRWAQDLVAASDLLRLRMAVVEDLDESQIAALPPDLGANVVVSEAPGLQIMALPLHQLDQLDREVGRLHGRTIVSNNHCAAHEPRLAAAGEIWEEHERFLDRLTFRPPRIPLAATLHPPGFHETATQLRRNRSDTTFVRVRWSEAIAALADRGIGRLVMLGPPSSGYALRKLRAADPALAHIRIKVAGTLAAIEGL